MCRVGYRAVTAEEAHGAGEAERVSSSGGRQREEEWVVGGGGGGGGGNWIGAQEQKEIA
jgi:hypothetical protein